MDTHVAEFEAGGTVTLEMSQGAVVLEPSLNGRESISDVNTAS